MRGLVDTGSLHQAARELATPYSSARNTLAELKKKLGVETVGMLIGQTLDMMDEQAGRAHLRHDLHALTDRQLAIASAISVAKSRSEAAKLIGVSEAVLDAELKVIYLVLGISHVGELASIVAEAQVSAGRTDPGTTGPFDHALPAAELRIGDRRVGYSDFGPANGSPVLILHSTITARAPPTRLVSELRNRGYRPIAIDRPGFGDTSEGPADAAPFALAASDTAAVCAALGIAKVGVIARGSGHAAVLLAQSYPHLVGRVVLVNPTPSVAFTPSDRGPLGMVKRRFARDPGIVELMIRTLSRFATPTRIKNGMMRSFRSSPPDAVLGHDDPQFVADYLRAVRDFAGGRIAGYVAEQTAWARGHDVAPMPGMTAWRIIQGRHFILHDPQHALAYWRARLPDTPVTRIDGAGQLLAYSHPSAVVDALD